jgi:FixJ family two-component response regulator
VRLHTDSERIDIDFKGTEEMQRRGIRAAAGTAMRMTIEEPIVYVVDDDASVRVALDSLVRSVGFRVQTFATAQDFLQHKPVNAPGCLVLDVQLPGLNGLDLQRELLHADIRIPIIFVTGHDDIPVSVRAMKAGATESRTKPFDDQDLLNAIQQAVERDRAAQQGRKDQESELEAAARIQQGLMAITTPQPYFAIVSGKNQPRSGRLLLRGRH